MRYFTIAEASKALGLSGNAGRVRAMLHHVPASAVPLRTKVVGGLKLIRLDNLEAFAQSTGRTLALDGLGSELRGDYVSAEEWARINAVTVKRLRKLLVDGKVEGAVRVGGQWLVPVRRKLHE